MTLSPGTGLEPHEVISPLGAGGLLSLADAIRKSGHRRGDGRYDTAMRSE